MPRVVTEKVPQSGNVAAEGRLAHEAVVPHARDNLVFRDDLSGVLGQDDQHVHEHRPEVPFGPRAPDRAGGRLDRPVSEDEGGVDRR